tara:strand:+ start:14247 stop:15566 length:1320 start_codon:yes stop_codon:yes gene_type:complete
MNNTENVDVSNLIEFSKIIKDLLTDLIITFNDKTEAIILKNSDFTNILNHTFADSDDNLAADSELVISMSNIFDYCKKVFPLKFLDILYQNEEIFTLDTELCFLPDINFSDLYFDTTTITTKETLWKYLQLILFSIITNVHEKESLGNNEKLFEAINGDEFKDKLQETVKNINNLFSEKTRTETDGSDDADLSNNNPFGNLFGSMNIDPSNIDNLPNTEAIHDHIDKLINGKLGNLAKELAEETTKDLGLDTENITGVDDLLKNLFKDPTKLMGIVNKISGKLDSKMKDGSLKESEILEEASDIFKNMQSMPGMESFQDIFKSMNMDQFMPKGGGKMNNNAFQNMMDQNIKSTRTKERMRKKAEANKNNGTAEAQTMESDNSQPEPNLNDINKNLASLMEQMKNNPDMFGGNGTVKTPDTPVGTRERKNNKKKNKGKKK